MIFGVSLFSRQSPFSVSIDKVLLESKQKKTVAVDGVTEVEDWDYIVEVKVERTARKPLCPLTIHVLMMKKRILLLCILMMRNLERNMNIQFS